MQLVAIAAALKTWMNGDFPQYIDGFCIAWGSDIWQCVTDHYPYISGFTAWAAEGEASGDSLNPAQHEQEVLCESMPLDKPDPKILRLEERVAAALGVGSGIDANHLVLKGCKIISSMILDFRFAAG
jgi:hypothetical protein